MHISTIAPSPLAKSTRVSTTLSAWKESSPVVGSSAMSTVRAPSDSARRSSHAIARRLLSPPEIPLPPSPPTTEFAHPPSPSLRITSSTLSLDGRPVSSKPAMKMRVSLTVSLAKKGASCGTKATL